MKKEKGEKAEVKGQERNGVKGQEREGVIKDPDLLVDGDVKKLII